MVRAAGETAELLRRHEADLRYISIVSQAVVAEDPGAKAAAQIEVLKAEGQNMSDGGIIPSRSEKMRLILSPAKMCPGDRRNCEWQLMTVNQ